MKTPSERGGVVSDPICYFEFDNHQRVQIRALETVGVVLERADRGGACHEFLVTYYWEGRRRAEWMRPFELADEPKKARSMIAPPLAQQPTAAVSAEEAIEAAYWDFDARHKGYGPHKMTPQSERDAFKWAVRALLAAAERKRASSFGNCPDRRKIMVSFDDLVRKHGRVKLYDDVCVEHIGFYAVESCACMGFIVYRDFEMIGAGSTVLEAMRSAGEGLRLEHPAAAVPEGYALVPVEPTPEMIAAGWFGGEMHIALGHANAYRECEGDYARLLAAALAADKENTND